jgi:DNA-binding NtrC family response regulator
MDYLMADPTIEEKIKPVVKDATYKVLGVSIDELTDDITSKLTISSLIDIGIDTSIRFKKAKKKFKKDYLEKMLKLNLGNISEVAKLTHVNRRSLHRLISEFDIDVNRIKKEMRRPYDIKTHAVGNVIEKVLDGYKQVIHPEKLEAAYEGVPEISEDIVKHMPEKPMSMKEAEEEFERRYLQKVLIEHNHNISHTAKAIGLRFETLHRKLKSLGLI